MLPLPTFKEFPAALKAKRVSLGFGRVSFSIRAQIDCKMPRLYEEEGPNGFVIPTLQKWLSLNIALNFVPGDEFEKEVALLNPSLLAILAVNKRRIDGVGIFYGTDDKILTFPVLYNGVQTLWQPLTNNNAG